MDKTVKIYKSILELFMPLNDTRVSKSFVEILNSIFSEQS